MGPGVDGGRGELTQRPDLFGALGERAEVAGGDHDHAFAVQFPGHGGCGRGGDQGGVEASVSGAHRM